MANIVDAVIGAIAPRMALKRAVARAQLDILERAYDGASQGRRLRNWNAPATSADAEILQGGERLRHRARDSVRSNAHSAKIVSVLADNIVGEGIVPRAAIPDADERNAEIDRLFEKWAIANGFYAQQYLACREMVEGGEILARKKIKRWPLDEEMVNLDVQLLEPDYLDTTKTTAKGKRSVLAGIEFDANYNRTGYWLRPKHPGAPSSTGSTATESKLVPAADVAHLFERQRTQERGVTWLAPVLLDLRDLSEYEQAEVVRKKIEACVVAIVTPGEDDPNDTGINAKVVDANGNVVEKFEPGMVAYSRGGKQINFNNPSVSAGYEQYERTQLRKIAAGARIPYELLSDDLSEVNFSSARVGIIEFRRFVGSVQWNTFIPMFCQRIWDWWLEIARLQGLIDVDELVPVEWSPPRFEHINPIDDVRADIAEVRAGFRSLPDVIASRGRAPKRVLTEIASTNEALDAAGIILDSDPRKVTAQGMFQLDPSAEGEKPEKPASKSPLKGKADGKSGK